MGRTAKSACSICSRAVPSSSFTAPSSSPASSAGPNMPAAAARSVPTRSRTSPTSTPATPPSPMHRAHRKLTSRVSRPAWTGRCPGTPSPTTSIKTSASTSGTATTSSSATATKSSARISSTTAATKPWAVSGAILDLTPLGRQEVWEDSPEGYPQTPPYKWWNWHDNYDAETSVNPKWVQVSDVGEAAFRKKEE